MKLLKSYRTEIDPSLEQIKKINQTIGVCRFVYNLFIFKNEERYKAKEKYINNYEFSKWLNNDFILNNPNYKWIKEVSSKSVRNSIDNANTAFMNYFNSLKKPKKKLTENQLNKAEKKKRKGIVDNYPKRKKKNKNESSMYFVKTDAKTIIQCERHRIKIPTLGWIKLKEKGYFPTNAIIKHGNISKKAGRYYVSITCEIKDNYNYKYTEFNEGIGIDLGVKDLAICSNKQVFENINKTKEVKRLEKKLKREQRSLSRMHENKKKGESTQKNIQKQKRKVQRIYHRLDNIRTDYTNKIIAEIVKTKPSYIDIEDLNISGMMKNKHLSKVISQQKLYEFRTKLTNKCHQSNIELRIVNRWFPSSKICNCCGNVKKDLRLSDRTYICDCGYVADRDYNASLNLRDCKDYKIA